MRLARDDPHGPRRLLAAALLSLALGGPGSAADQQVTRIANLAFASDAVTVLASLSLLGDSPIEFDVDALIAGLGSAKLELVLVDAAPSGQRQALAHALGCWWAKREDGSVLLTQSRRLPLGKLDVISLTSVLGNQPATEGLVRRFLDPWLGPDTGISLLPSVGSWSATLDHAGRARLDEVIGMIERGVPQCSSFVPDPEQPDLQRRLAAPVAASTWHDLVGKLAQAGACSVSLGAALRGAAFPPGGVRLPDCRLTDLPRALADVGLDGRFIHGVLCLGRPAQRATDREHPAERRRLALIPIPHLVTSQDDGELIATALKRLTGGDEDWWSQPGADLVFLTQFQALLVAADAQTQAEIIAALGALDRLGLAAGLAALAAKQP